MSVLENFHITIFSIVGTFIIGYLLAILVNFSKRKTAKSQSINSMIHELNDGIIPPTSNRTNTVIVENKEVSVNFEPLPTTAFDHVLFSGTYREFDVETQSLISSLFTEIKTANVLGMQLRTSLSTSFIAVGNFHVIMSDFGAIVDRRLNDIHTHAQSLIEHLENNR